MTTSKITSGAGLRAARVYLLGADGYPTGDQAGANLYDGISVTGVKAVTLNQPETVRVQHKGNDRVFAQDTLPPNELPSGSVTTAKANQELDTALITTKTQTIGDAFMDPQITDKQGSEADIMLLYHRQALNTDATGGTAFGKRRWQNFIIAKTRMVPGIAGADQGADDVNSYALIPTPITTTPWGAALSLLNNGATEAVRLRLMSDYPLMFEFGTGNNTLPTFNLVKTPISAAKTVAWVNGTPASVSSVDTSAKTVTLASAPAHLAAVAIAYETSDPII